MGISKKNLRKKLSDTAVFHHKPNKHHTSSKHKAASHSHIDRTMSCRFELKYRITEAKAAAVVDYIRPYLAMDHFSKEQPDKQYPIVSTYFDSDSLQLCMETIEKKKNRFKLRIRSYSDHPDTPCFFEVKRRLDRTILKGRARVTKDSIAPILAGSPLPPQNTLADKDVIDQFLLYKSYLVARPMIKVKYKRTAYEGDSKNRVRVTFDRSLAFKACKEPQVLMNDSGWNDAPIGFVILEIKFTSHYPAWINHMIGYLNLDMSSMSKYCTCIKSSCNLGFAAPQYKMR